MISMLHNLQSLPSLVIKSQTCVESKCDAFVASVKSELARLEAVYEREFAEHTLESNRRNVELEIGQRLAFETLEERLKHEMNAIALDRGSQVKTLAWVGTVRLSSRI
jgi:hypothetical protein